MTLAGWLGLAGAWIVAIASPGPDTVQLIRLGARSRRVAVAAALGICTGNVLWPTVTMLGLAALIAASPWVLTLLYLCGGLFLLRMGIGAARGGLADVRSGAKAPVGEERASDSNRQLSALAGWKMGLATNLSNPKALLFFGAVFAQFVPPAASAWERVAVIAAMTLIGVLWFCGFALVVSMPRWAERLQRANPVIELVVGVIFLLLGGFLVWEGVWRLPFVSA